MKLKIIVIFITLCLCASWFKLTEYNVFVGAGATLNAPLFNALNNGFWNNPVFLNVWKIRVVDLWLTSQLVTHTDKSQEQILFVFGLWQAVWLMATFMVLIAFLKEPLLVIFAIFSAMLFTYSFDMGSILIFPWDRPSMFFWTLAICLWHARWYWWMVTAIVIGTLFKESVCLAAVLFFFVPSKQIRCAQN